VGGPCRGVSISGDIGVPITRTDVQGSHQPVTLSRSGSPVRVMD